MTDSVDVAVIGGGITGLTVAFLLQRHGLNVRLLSAESKVGGAIRTIRERGFLCEAGAMSVMPRGPEFLNLLDACGLGDQILLPSTEAHRIFLLHGGMLHRLPMDPVAFLCSPLFSHSAKFRLLREPLIGRSTTEESVAEFFVRRVGREIFDCGIEPLLPGTLAGSAGRLSMRSTLPAIHALEQQHGSMTRGLISAWLHGKATRTRTYARGMTFASGLQTLTDTLAITLGSACLTNARATAVNCARDSGDGTRYSVSYDSEGHRYHFNADEIVLAIPAHAAAEIIAPHSAIAAEVLTSIPYASLLSVCFGFQRKDVQHPMDGFGYFLPASERRHLLGCFWNSSQYRNRAPRDHVVISALLGDSIDPHLTSMPNGEAVEVALQEISRTMQIRGKPVYLHCARWARSIPQYEIGHAQRMERLREFEKDFPGITLAGSYRGGISIGARVAEAHRHTRNIIARIDRSRSMRQSSSPIQRSA